MIQHIQLDKLKAKRTEIEDNYKKAKAHRIEIINSINELDDKIKEVDDRIQEFSQSLLEKHLNRLKNNKLIKYYIISATTQWSLAILFGSLINLLVQGRFWVNPIGIITTGITVGMLNFIQYKSKVSKTKNIKNSKIKYKNLEDLEQQRKKLIEERITKGSEYKRAREEEVLREKIYKQLDPILAIEMKRILDGKNIQQKTKDINTRDIYHKIKLDYSFDRETIENKKIILDNELKIYISSKISEVYHNVLEPKDLAFLTTEELVKMLIQEIPIEKHNDILSNIIHAILNFSCTLQGYGVVWYEEKNLSLINNPTVTFTEDGKWNEFKTHKNTNYYQAFQIAYNTFINDVMNKQKIKNRTKSNY